MRPGIALFLLGSIALGPIACSSTAYYRVTDPVSGKRYYTKEMYQSKGVTHLEDAKNGDAVVLQNSEIRRISKHEFEHGRVEP